MGGLAAAVVAVFTLTTAARVASALTITVTAPTETQRVRRTVAVYVDVQTMFVITSAQVTLDGTSTRLSPTTTCGTGCQRLSALLDPVLPSGTKQLAIAVTDASGAAATATAPFIFDPPVVVALDVEPGAIVGTTLRVQGTCDDDGAPCTSVTVVCSSPRLSTPIAHTLGSAGRFDEVFDITTMEGTEVTVTVVGSDPYPDGTVVRQTSVFANASPRLLPAVTTGGAVHDTDLRRVLHSNAYNHPQAPYGMSIYDRATGTDTPIDPTPVREGGQLTPNGAFWIVDLNQLVLLRNGILARYPSGAISLAGNYMTWQSFTPEATHWIDLATGIDTPVGGASIMLPGANGVLYYYHNGSRALIRRFGASETLVGNELIPTATDGDIVVVSPAGVCGVDLYNASGLVEHLDLAPCSIRQGFAIQRAGWTVYYEVHSLPAPPYVKFALRSRAPGGAHYLLADDLANPFAEDVAPSGEVVFVDGLRRFKVAPGTAPVDISGSFGRAMWRDGYWLVALGHTLFGIDVVPPAPPPPVPPDDAGPDAAPATPGDAGPDAAPSAPIDGGPAAPADPRPGSDAPSHHGGCSAGGATLPWWLGLLALSSLRRAGRRCRRSVPGQVSDRNYNFRRSSGMRIQSLVVIGLVLAATARAEARDVQLVVVAPTGQFLDFGRTPFASPSSPQRIVIRNAGNGTAHDLSEINGGPFEIVATGGDFGPGHEKFYDIVCNPFTANQFFNAGNFHYDACAPSCGVDESEGNISLSCTGGLLDPDDYNSSGPAVFAYEISQARTVFTNPGSAPLTITGFAADPAVFSAALASGTLPLTLAPGDSADVIVSFDSSGLSFINDPVFGHADVLAGTSIIGRVDAQGYVLSQIDPLLISRFIVPQGAAYTIPISVRNSFPSTRTITAVTSDDLSCTMTGVVGAVLTPGARVHGLVTVTANLLGARTGHVAVAFDTGQGDTVQVLAEVVAPRFSITTDDATPDDGRLDFGTRLAGSGPIERTVTFTNLDSAELPVASCIDSFPPFAVELSGPCPTAIPVGGSITATVRFTPVDGGDTGGSMGIFIPGLGSAYAFLSARVYQLTFSATAVEFPDTPRADTADQVVAITNAGITPVSVPVAVSGIGFTSHDATVTVPGGGTADVHVAFQPPAAGMFTGTLEIGGAGDLEHTVVSLSGTGVSPLVSVAPSLDLGAVVEGTTGEATLEIRNQDLVHSFTIDDLVVTGAGFSAVMPDDPVLMPGATRQITVAFSPTAVGAAAGTLAIVLAGDPSPHAIVSLSASGIAAPEIPSQPRPHTGGCDAGGTGGAWPGLAALALWLAGRRRSIG